MTWPKAFATAVEAIALAFVILVIARCTCGSPL